MCLKCRVVVLICAKCRVVVLICAEIRVCCGALQPVQDPVTKKRKRDPSAAGELHSSASMAAAAAAAAAVSTPSSRGENFRIIERYKPILCAEYAAADTLVVVEAPWVKVAPTLPDQVYRGVYGRK